MVALFGEIFGVFIHHDSMLWNRLGRAAYLEHAANVFQKSMVHPRPLSVQLMTFGIFALIVAGTYELLVAGLSKLAKTRY